MKNTGTAHRRSGRRGFRERYGAWALVAGASEGIGAAYSRALAAREMNLFAVARREAPLERLADELRARFSIEVRCAAGDLGDRAFLESLSRSVSELDLGVVVYNAAVSPVGDFVDAGVAELERALDVNVRGPVVLLRALLPTMARRGRGAVVLMSSLAGNQGSPRIATYAATKGFTRVLAEGLWSELRPRGIDVLVCAAGAVRTPGYGATAGRDAPGTLDPDDVAERALRALGRGPVVVPGLVNRAAAALMGRLLPQRTAIRIMSGSTSNLNQPEQR
jgi:short-subunit dehydrogenase